MLRNTSTVKANCNETHKSQQLEAFEMNWRRVWGRCGSSLEAGPRTVCTMNGSVNINT